ncbi:hypothetical protein ID866_9655 [Astraeus odoratus]|nr:hypothetical protein ID866_9655 [Astraeus odoratus]
MQPLAKLPIVESPPSPPPFNPIFQRENSNLTNFLSTFPTKGVKQLTT